MIKICHIASGDLWAGAEVLTFNLLRELQQKQELQIHAIILNPGRLADELKSKGINVHVINEQNMSFLKLLYHVFLILKKHKITIVHSHRYKENLLATLASIPLPTISKITTIHGVAEAIPNAKNGFNLKSNINFFLLRYFFHKSICVSNDCMNFLLSHKKLKTQSACVIHNGITIPTPIDCNSVDQTEDFSIGTACRLVPIKNIEFLLDVAVLLKGAGIKIIIAGDGPLKTLLEARSLKLGVSDIVQFAGQVDAMEMFYNSIDVYLNTSLHEGIPMSILEAMSLRLPVVATNVGGISEIIEHEKTGFLVTLGDVKSFARYCLLLRNDRKLLHKMANNAKLKISEQFSINSCAEKYVNLYKNN